MDKMMSLFEYLGKPAGGDLGKKVYLAARAKNVNHSQREVSTRTYTGMVMLYPESFLGEYFKSEADKFILNVVDASNSEKSIKLKDLLPPDLLS